LALIAKIVDHVSSMENMHMIQRNNSPTRRLVAARRVALLASVAGAGIAVLAGGPDLYTASNPSTWISSAAAADIHGWMGVRIQPVTADIADSLGLKKAEGALVAEPQSGSPAAKAGILAGDVITAVDGNEVKTPRDLARKISATAPGTDVKLTIQRKGEEKTVSVTLGQQPEQRQGDTSTDPQQGSPFQKFLRQFGFEDTPDGMQDWRFGQNWPFRIPQMQTTTASDIHGWIGVRIQAVTADIADGLGLKKAEGALVAEPQSDSPAAKAGILAGDVITAVDGKDVKDPGDLARKISATASGTDVKLTIQRKGEEKTVSVTLGQQPEQRQGDTGTDRRVMPDGTPRLGLTLAPASDVGGAGDQGVAVTSVDPNGPAAEHGIKTGDVILEVAGQAVSKPEDVRQQLANLQKDGKHTLLMRVKSGDTTTFVAVRLGKA
jgi:S1-C subfamily serine protease